MDQLSVEKEGSIDHIGQTSYERSTGLGGCVAFFGAALQVGDGGLATSGMGDGDPEDGGAELAVGGPAQTVSFTVS